MVEAVTENDYRMAAPAFCPVGFHAMMLQCWESDGEDRGTFADKHAALVVRMLGFSPRTRLLLNELLSEFMPVAGL